MTKNRFCHFELSTNKVDEAKAFYKKLFDWKFNFMKEMDYTMIDLGEKETGGGIQKLMMPDQPVGWLSYVEVASVQKTLDKVTAGGGSVVVPKTSVGGMGFIGIFMDPVGASLGIWERAAPPKATAKKKVATKKAAKKVTKKAAKKATKKKK